MKALFHFFPFFILLIQSAVFSENACEAEGTCDMECEDLEHDCGQRAKDRQCEENPSYMLQFCARSCNACGGNFPEQFAVEGADEAGVLYEEEDFDDEDDLDFEENIDGKEQDEYGVVQAVDGEHKEEILQAMESMRVYFSEARNDPGTTSTMHTILDNCTI
jgi:ShK domain-like